MALDTVRIPLIARVHGAAIGGGTGLAAVADIAIASTDAMFGFTEVKLGILPAVISPFALAKIGRSAARELFLTGARFDAERAREIGLVQRVVDDADVDAAVSETARALLDGGPEAQARIKRLLPFVATASMEDARRVTPSEIANARAGAEAREGLSAFLEKRKPRWSRGE